MTIFEKLAAQLPSIHWRAQTLRKGDGTRPHAAMALAYMDARDVMDRLDTVVGPDCWKDSYVETVKGRVICTLSIKIDGEWVSKSDGAGDTDVEGEKGGLSDAFKRAAVKWGIGRYLYRMDAVWAECEVGNNGKWRRWTPKGLKTLEAAAAKFGAKMQTQPDEEQAAPPASVTSFLDNLAKADDRAAYWLEHFKAVPAEWRQHCVDFKDSLKKKEAA